MKKSPGRCSEGRKDTGSRAEGDTTNGCAKKGKEVLYNVHHARSFFVSSCEKGDRRGKKDARGE